MKRKRWPILLWGVILVSMVCGWEEFNSGYGNYSLDPGPNENYDFQHPVAPRVKNRIECKNLNTAGDLKDLKFTLMDSNGNVLDYIIVGPGKSGHLDIPANYKDDEVIVLVSYHYKSGNYYAGFDGESYPYPKQLPPPK